MTALAASVPGLAPASAQAPAAAENLLQSSSALRPRLEFPAPWPAELGVTEHGARDGLAPGAAFLASAVLPGAGQRLLGAERWVLYAALEIWSWIAYVDHRGDGRALEREYRDLAWLVARRLSTGERRDAGFDYYETLADPRYEGSGAFDTDPGRGGVQPETDPRTVNGQVWQLAREFFLPGGAQGSGGAGLDAALSYYVRHAVPPEFAWSWGDNVLERELYRSLIRRSDEAYRDATSLLGVILANHLLSAVDALVLARLSQETGTSRVRLRGGAEPAAAGARWWIQLSLPVP